ncbi:hypothetical protein HanRHA438_Chr12g0542191 [Helianthus annuus]|nr:hypothetical protein HanRHA438_Chr12g0542191 [Helianthus annuus]
MRLPLAFLSAPCRRCQKYTKFDKWAPCIKSTGRKNATFEVKEDDPKAEKVEAVIHV